MTFMRPEVHQGPVYLVEGQNGTDLVPADMVGYLGLPLGHEVDIDGGSVIWPSIVAALADYVSDRNITSVEYTECWYGRLSASGYMDCTDWTWEGTKQDVLDSLAEMYGDEESDHG